MGKYASVFIMLAAVIVFAALYTWYGTDEFIAGIGGPQNTSPSVTGGENPSPPPYAQVTNPPPTYAQGTVLPPVYAPEHTVVLTTPPPLAALESEPDLTGLAVDALTGLYIDEEAAMRRPFVVVYNNKEQAMPQSGISQAGIVYEVLSEGDITRLIAVFQDFDTKKIGSVRSARHYFIDIALDYDAFFVHFGGSPQAFTALKNLKIDNINGIALDGGVKTSNFDSVTFWRDATRYAVSSMREHSAYTSAANLIKQAEKYKYRMNKKEGAKTPFEFYAQVSSAEGAAPASRIEVTFVSSNPSVFVYSESTGLYSRFQFKGQKPHIDEETGKQIAVTNVIVQLTSVKAIAGDTEGRRDIAVVGSGKGYLFTNGSVIPLKWSKSSSTSPTVWTFENGEKLTLNKGKTWICITNKEPVFN